MQPILKAVAGTVQYGKPRKNSFSGLFALQIEEEVAYTFQLNTILRKKCNSFIYARNQKHLWNSNILKNFCGTNWA